MEAISLKTFKFAVRDNESVKLPRVLQGRYVFDQKLNYGSYGTIFNVVDVVTKRYVVAKISVSEHKV